MRLQRLDDLDLIEIAMPHFVDAAHAPFAQLGDDLEAAFDLGECGHHDPGLRSNRKSTPSCEADWSGA